MSGTQSETLQSERFCRVCKHSLRGLVSHKCPECGRPFDPGDPRTTSPFQHSEFVELIAVTSRFLLVTTVLLSICSFIVSATAYTIEPFMGPFLLWLFGIPWIPVSLVLVIVAFRPWARMGRRMRMCAVVCPILYVAVVLTDWPLRLNLLVHKPWLERLADQVQSGSTIGAAGRVGLFRYRQVRLIPEGNVGLQLSGGAGGGTYLVRVAPTATRVWYNTNWEISLGDNWYLAYED
jgi:hypothetical protein